MTLFDSETNSSDVNQAAISKPTTEHKAPSKGKAMSLANATKEEILARLAEIEASEKLASIKADSEEIGKKLIELGNTDLISILTQIVQSPSYVAKLVEDSSNIIGVLEGKKNIASKTIVKTVAVNTPENSGKKKKIVKDTRTDDQISEKLNVVDGSLLVKVGGKTDAWLKPTGTVTKKSGLAFNVVDAKGGSITSPPILVAPYLNSLKSDSCKLANKAELIDAIEGLQEIIA